MGRRYEYDIYLEENRDRYFMVNLEHQTKLRKRPSRSRPRDPVESALLDRLAVDSWNRAVSTGELEILGPRRYRLNVRV